MTGPYLHSTSPSALVGLGLSVNPEGKNGSSSGRVGSHKLLLENDNSRDTISRPRRSLILCDTLLRHKKSETISCFPCRKSCFETTNLKSHLPIVNSKIVQPLPQLHLNFSNPCKAPWQVFTHYTLTYLKLRKIETPSDLPFTHQSPQLTRTRFFFRFQKSTFCPVFEPYDKITVREIN